GSSLARGSNADRPPVSNRSSCRDCGRRTAGGPTSRKWHRPTFSKPMPSSAARNAFRSLTPRYDSGVPHAAPDAAVVRQLEQIEAQLASTWTNRDCAGWSALLADDWSVTHIDGQIMTKAQALEMCRSGPPVTSTFDQLAIRIYGDTAIVTGRNRATAP